MILEDHAELAKGRDIPEEARRRLKEQFGRMMKALFREEGTSLRIELLEDPEVTGFIDEHASVLDASFEQVEMSERMRSRLQESDWIFSGMKTFHELNEAFPSLLDETGHRKPFESFLNDVQSIDETYNRNYLRAEYNYAEASAEMAARWEDFEENGDDYYLQYRTAGDDKVRPEHAALHGVTLPMSDSFWDEYYPPNGWNCRCTVVQVLKDKYPATDRAEAYARGRQALAKDKKGMFHFNSGKQGKTFPDYNPYTLSKCTSCTRKLNLMKGIPDNELCDWCLSCRSDYREKVEDVIPHLEEYISHEDGMVMQSPRHGTEELEENLSIGKRLAAFLGKRVFLLPRIDSNTEEQLQERKEYMPKGVKDPKNPDFYVEGVVGLFDGKSLLKFAGGVRKVQKQYLENRYKAAKDQAEHMVFDLADTFTESYLDGIFQNILKQSSVERIIVVFYKGQGRMYTKK